MNPKFLLHMGNAQAPGTSRNRGTDCAETLDLNSNSGVGFRHVDHISLFCAGWRAGALGGWTLFAFGGVQYRSLRLGPSTPRI